MRHLQSQAARDTLIEMVKGRYGSPAKVADTLYTDPVGAAADLSTGLSGGSGLLGGCLRGPKAGDNSRERRK